MATDGRYFLQAGRQLDSNWELLKQGVPGVLSWYGWVAKEANENGYNIGVDPRLISNIEYNALKNELALYGLEDKLVAVTPNLIDLVWADKQPKPSKDDVIILPLEYAGVTATEKIKQLRKAIHSKRGSGFVITALDEVAWLLNLRGADIAFNPVFRSFVYVSSREAILYIDKDKINPQVAEYLADNDVTVKDYYDIADDLRQAKADLLMYNASVKTVDLRKKVLASGGISWDLYDALGGSEYVSVIPSPVEYAKSIKNRNEIYGARQCQIRDGAALIKYFSWLENELKNGKTYSDYEVGQKSKEIRSKMDKFMGLSFETISSSGLNAAVIHYAPAKDSKYIVDINQVYLCDSGAQYLDGTTDTSRTLFFGDNVDPEIAHRYTLVLKGHIAIARTVFPEGTNGYYLDVLARQFLWAEGLDYRHGTGHGVGSFLNVHEGPIGIGVKVAYGSASFVPGQILSNEPGYYKDGEYGLRIENVVLVTESGVHNEFGKKNYAFETITRVPMCRKLIEVESLTKEEIKWLNNYHKKVYEDTISYVVNDDLAREWLKRETAPI